MLHSGVGFPAFKGFDNIDSQIIPVLRMKRLIIRVDIIVYKTDFLHSLKHFIILTTNSFCRTLYTRSDKTYF